MLSRFWKSSIINIHRFLIKQKEMVREKETSYPMYCNFMGKYSYCNRQQHHLRFFFNSNGNCIKRKNTTYIGKQGKKKRKYKRGPE